MEILKQLFPNSTHLQLLSWHLDEAETQITLIVSSKQTVVPCPVCAFLTHRIHSHYERRLADLSWAEYRVSWQLQVRKYFCLNQQCQRRIFTERLPGIVAPWARRTQRLAAQLSAIGLAVGGALGVKLSHRLGLITSRNTLLSSVRALPLPPVVTPRILGVDDFAFRKRQTYGTILLDLECHQPITLLSDREAETLAEWLKEHPGVEVVSRDRSKAYAKAITQGAPSAIQVADRFHLLQNLAETLDQVFGSHAKVLKSVEKQDFGIHAKAFKEAETAHNLSHKAEAITCPVVPKFPQNTSLKRKVQSAKARARRQAIHEQVWNLRSQGWSGQAIAQELGVSKTTVFNYLRHSTFTERRQRSDQGLSLLNPYQDYILSRWNSGYYNTQGLYEEIRQAGYTGSYATVGRFTRYLKSLPGFEPGKRSRKDASPKLSSSSQRALTPSRATALVLRRPESQEPEDEQLIAQLKAGHPDLGAAIDLAQQFAALVRQRLPEQLGSWLDKAKNSSVSLLRRFALGKKSDYKAVKAGVTLSTSNGPVEGQINRLKMLKCQMFGRAGLDLLTRRFVLAL